MSGSPHLFDRALHLRRLDRAAAGFAQADFLKRRAAQDAALRLEAIMREFPVAVDLSARSGAFRQTLAESPAQKKMGGAWTSSPPCSACIGPMTWWGP
jgi:hypothetical protein